MLLFNGYLKQMGFLHAPTDIIGLCIAFYVDIIVNKWDHNEADEEGDIKLDAHNTRITVTRNIFFKRKYFKGTDV